MATFPGVARVSAAFTRGFGDQTINVLHFRKQDLVEATVAEMEDLLEQVDLAFWDDGGTTNDVREITSNDVTLASLTAVSMDVANAGIYAVRTINEAGSSAQENLSPQLAIVTKHQTAVATRSGRGRTYLGNLTTEHLVFSTSGVPMVPGATVTLLNTMWAALDAAVDSLTPAWERVIPSIVDEIARPVISSTTRSLFFTQRRRGPRGPLVAA